MNNLVRFDPFAEMRSLQKQFFGDDFFAPLRNVSLPATDVYTRNDKELVVEAHLPNFEDKDVNIHVEDSTLVIQAEKHEKEEDKDKKYVVRESSSSFYRRITLPKQSDADNIHAQLNDGVLKVTVPFKALPEPKKISIKTSKKS